MVRYGLGCGEFPRHCVEALIQTKELFAYTHQLKRDPVGDIYIVSRKNFILPARVQKVLDPFWK